MFDYYETFELWIDGTYVLPDEAIYIAFEDILDVEPSFTYQVAA